MLVKSMKKTEKKVKQEVFLGEVPKMTERATFIVNGIERVIVNQIVRSPGVFFTAAEGILLGALLGVSLGILDG